MSTALTYIYYIFNKCLTFVFSDMLIANNVSVGWIYISIIVFGVLVGSILNIPHRIGNFSNFGTHETVSSSYYDSNGEKHTYWRRYNGVK